MFRHAVHTDLHVILFWLFSLILDHRIPITRPEILTSNAHCMFHIYLCLERWDRSSLKHDVKFASHGDVNSDPRNCISVFLASVALPPAEAASSGTVPPIPLMCCPPRRCGWWALVGPCQWAAPQTRFAGYKRRGRVRPDFVPG